MRPIEQIAICALLGYLIGGLNPSFLLAKAKGFDIRGTGSGNAGASNATIAMGKKAGVFCALFDIFKAYMSVKIGMKLYPFLKAAGLIAGACCILGHIFPILMNFRGGKGLASLGGTVLAYNAKIFVALLLLELIIVLATDYICIVPTSGSFLFLLYLVTQGVVLAITFIPVVYAIFLKHKENFRRIEYGVEARFSYLWNKNEETQRLQSNWDRLTEEERSSFESVYI